MADAEALGLEGIKNETVDLVTTFFLLCLSPYMNCFLLSKFVLRFMAC